MSTVKSNKPLVRKQQVNDENTAPVEETPTTTKNMNKGRKKKYASDEERKVARRIQQREYRVRKAQELAKLRKLYNKDQKAHKQQEEVVEEIQHEEEEEKQ